MSVAASPPVVARHSAEDRLIGLELLRVLAALGVLVWHYQHFTLGPPGVVAWDDSRMPMRWLLAPFYDYGYAGVQLFWCISGFIFTWKYAAVISRAELSFRRFALLRFSRLYPLHLATLLIVAALQWLFLARNGGYFIYRNNDVIHFVSNLLFTNWWDFIDDQSFNGPSWSVAAEVLIYCVFFFVARRVGRGWQVDGMILLGFVAADTLLGMFWDGPLALAQAGRFFFLGALTCHAYAWIETQRPRLRRRFTSGFAGLIAFYCVGMATGVIPFGTAIQMIFPAALLLAQLAVQPSGPGARSLLIGFGNLTYATYMLHFPIQLLAMLIIGAAGLPLQPLVYSNWFLLGYIGTVTAVAWVVFRFLERPAQAWLRGLGRKPGVTVPVP